RPQSSEPGPTLLSTPLADSPDGERAPDVQRPGFGGTRGNDRGCYRRLHRRRRERAMDQEPVSAPFHSLAHPVCVVPGVVPIAFIFSKRAIAASWMAVAMSCCLAGPNVLMSNGVSLKTKYSTPFSSLASSRILLAGSPFHGEPGLRIRS